MPSSTHLERRSVAKVCLKSCILLLLPTSGISLKAITLISRNQLSIVALPIFLSPVFVGKNTFFLAIGMKLSDYIL